MNWVSYEVQVRQGCAWDSVPFESLGVAQKWARNQSRDWRIVRIQMSRKVVKTRQDRKR